MTEPSEECVQDYPRPPALVPVSLPLRVVLGGVEIAVTTSGFRVLETHHAPTYYLPPSAFARGSLTPAPGRSFCEWKGRAQYWDLAGGGKRAARAGWSYPAPTRAFIALKDHLAVYCGAVDACFVGDEQVRPQPGGFYGGWVTSNLTGTIKGAPGTEGW